jgi:hypothetical protein
MTRRGIIGFDRRLSLDWLEAAGSRVAAGATLKELRADLWAYLEGKVSGDTYNSDRGKTMTVLIRIWGTVPPAVEPLKIRATAAFQTTKVQDHLTLQDTFSLAQLTNRMVAQWSERPVLVKSTQRIIRSLVDWGALADTNTRGMYQRAPKPLPISKELAQLLCEALLLDNEQRSLPAPQLLEHPALFPFTHSLTLTDLRAESRFAVHRQGLAGDLVELRPAKAA